MQFPHSIPVSFAGLLLLAACTPPEALWTPAYNPKDVKVERTVRSVVVTPPRDRLADADAAILHAMVLDLGQPERTRVTVALPPGTERQAATPIVRALAGLGVDPASIAVTAAPGIAPGAAPGTLPPPGRGVTVTAEIHAAVAPACPDWSHSRLDEGTFQPSSNLGCANANNFAHMLADPGDLVAPRRLEPASGAAQAAAVERYLTNKVTPLAPSNITLGAKAK